MVASCVADEVIQSTARLLRYQFDSFFDVSGLDDVEFQRRHAGEAVEGGHFGRIASGGKDVQSALLHCDRQGGAKATIATPGDEDGFS